MSWRIWSTEFSRSTRPCAFSCVSSALMRSSSCFCTFVRRWFVMSMRLRASSSSNSAARAGSASANAARSAAAATRSARIVYSPA
jgi:hypothetical protein